MNWNRNLLVLCFGLALAAVLSCSGELPLTTQVDDTPPNENVAPVDSTATPVDTVTAPVDTVTAPVDTVPSIPDDTTGLGPQDPRVPGTTVLVCDAQPYASVTAQIGRAGGQIFVGNHSLKIPEGALKERVTITMEQVEGTANSVRFSPEGLYFIRPPVLTLSYKNCPNVKHWKRIVYTDELLNILEPTLSLDFSSSSQVKGLIYHFSRYAVAF